MSTLSWERCGTRFFRTFEGPALKWKVSIRENHVLSAANGGVTAVWERDDVFVSKPVYDDLSKPQLKLYSGNGSQIGSIPLDFGAVSGVNLTDDETVVIVSSSGIARHYTDLGANFVQIRLEQGARDLNLFENGYCVRCDSENAFCLQFVYFSAEIGNTRVTQVNKPLSHDVARWKLVPRIENEQQSLVVVQSSENRVYVYSTDLEPRPTQTLQNMPNKFIELSASNKLIVFSDGERFVVYKTDFRTLVCEHAAKHTCVRFIGDEAVALLTDQDCITVVDLLDVENSSDIYFDDSELSLQTETDALRVYGERSHVLLLPVSLKAEQTLKLGSIAPSAILYSCVDQIKDGSPRANATIQSLDKQSLTEAVDTCISTALEELEPKAQEKLLRAARFGKSVLLNYDSTHYVQTITALQIGNNVRELQLFSTNTQLNALGLNKLLNRLQTRRFWPEAVAVAKLMRAPFESIYANWACFEIENSVNSMLNDEDLLDLLDKKLLNLPALSYTEIVHQALTNGRKQLALFLISREPVVKNRISLLLEMNDVSNVLDQALNSGNIYLVDYVLMILSVQLSTPQLMRLLNGNKLALRRQELLLKALNSTNDALFEFLGYMDDRETVLRYEFKSVVDSPSTLASSTEQLLNLSTRFTALGKQYSLETKACKDWSRLLDVQKQLEQDFHEKFIGKSSSETVSALLRLAQPHVAQKTSAKLGIPERQFWWLQLQSLAERHQWAKLFDLATNSKSLIGYKPFYDACFEGKNFDLAAKFVPMIQEAGLEEKVNLYLKVNDIEKARELAAKSRNPQLRSRVEESINA